MEAQNQQKIDFIGRIISVQPRSNVWRYRLDNRTHSLTGYNLFLSGEVNGAACVYADARTAAARNFNRTSPHK